MTANLNRYARSIILACSGASIHDNTLQEYDTHYHEERNHQGKGNALLMPRARKEGWNTIPIHSREQLGGLLKYYSRETA